MKKSPIWFVFSFGMVMILFLANCTPAAPAPTTAIKPTDSIAAPAPTTEVKAPDAQATITYWSGFEEKSVQDFITGFEAAHPNIKVQYTYIQDQNTLLTALAAGEGPDIFETDGPAFSMQFAQAGQLLDLTSYATMYGWKGKVLPWAYNVGVLDGKLYSLSQTFETLVLYYNPTMFSEKGWQTPKSWADVQNLCEKASAAGIWCFAHGGGSTLNDWYTSSYLSQYAGSDLMYKAFTGSAKFTDAPFIDAVKLMKSEMDKGWWSGNLDNYTSFDWPSYKTSFCEGKSAMMISGTWDFYWLPQDCKDAGFEKVDWDWMPIPAMKEGVTPNYPLAIGSMMVVNAKSKAPDAAAAFLDWLVGDTKRAAHQASIFNFGEWVAPLNYTAPDFPSGTDARVTRYLIDFGKVTGEGNIGYTTWTFLPTKTENYSLSGLAEVFANKTTPEQFMENWQKLFDEEKSNGKVPPIPKPGK